MQVINVPVLHVALTDFVLKRDSSLTVFKSEETNQGNNKNPQEVT